MHLAAARDELEEEEQEQCSVVRGLKSKGEGERGGSSRNSNGEM